MERINVEVRAAAIEGNKLSGLAHMFGQRTKLGRQYEEFAPTAFNKVLESPLTDVRAFMNHDPGLLLGRQSSGTLRLSVEEEGLAFSLDLPNTTYANDLRELVKRGDLDGASFAFIPGEVALSRAADGLQVRRHISVLELIDISPVSLPAFAGTSVQLRSLDTAIESLRSQTARARARVVARNNRAG